MGLDNLRRAMGISDKQIKKPAPKKPEPKKIVKKHTKKPDKPTKKSDDNIDLQKVKRLWKKMRDSISNRWESANATGWMVVFNEFDNEIQKIK